MSKLLVVGSISTDFVVETKREPKVGGTIFGETFETHFGGKGANQAVAAARLGAEVEMFGAVGSDVFGERLLDNLKKNAVGSNHVQIIKDAPSGSAVITVMNGDNMIIYVAGANDAYTPDCLFQNQQQIDMLKQSDMVLVQNELPQATIEKLIDQSYQNRIPVLYNPAPARKLTEELMKFITFLTPNETEFQEMFPGQSISNMLEKYSNKLIVTLGQNGAQFHDGDKIVTVPAIEIEHVVDTTGAGDTFNGAFAVAYMEGQTLEECVRFANKAAAVSIQKSGAQNGMPSIEDIPNLCNR
ncbi:ribokinase [Marinilactibacillus sp. Marseille-P9653]|uniref:ribokinase n=1 Tax=Marinilactibacillus sp. Marseille-P9653 TaxID=2866583 RepID=UPI001CE45510|nr:ribokinase [Marinilactibacillus sp. Marseille-P9653]